MDSGLPPLVWELRILVEPLVICGKSDFFKEFLNMVFFMVLPLTSIIKLLIITCKNGSFTIEWE